MSRLNGVPPFAVAGLFVLPIAAIWVTKVFFEVFFTLPETISYSPLLPAFYGLIILYYLFVLDLTAFNLSSFIKIYLPIIFISLLATFVFSAWSKSYFISKGYQQVKLDGFEKRLFSIKFKK